MFSCLASSARSSARNGIAACHNTKSPNPTATQWRRRSGRPDARLEPDARIKITTSCAFESSSSKRTDNLFGSPAGLTERSPFKFKYDPTRLAFLYLTFIGLIQHFPCCYNIGAKNYFLSPCRTPTDESSLITDHQSLLYAESPLSAPPKRTRPYAPSLSLRR